MAAAALLFDLDGTLWDSRPWVAHVFVTRCGKRQDIVASRLASDVSPVTLARDLAIPRATFVRACSDCARDLKLYDGVIDTLNALTRRRMRMGVVTSLARDVATAMLSGHDLTRYFEVLVTPTRPAQAKATSLRQALSQMGLLPDRRIYYVGDKEADAQAANGTGLSFAWAAYGYGNSEPAGTAVILRGLPDVLLV